ERAGRGVQQHERQQQRQEGAAERKDEQREREGDAARAHDPAAVPRIAEQAERRLEGAAEDVRYGREEADLDVREAQVGADQGPGSRPRAGDELIEELDEQQDGGRDDPTVEASPGNTHRRDPGVDGVAGTRAPALSNTPEGERVPPGVSRPASPGASFARLG